LYATVWSGTVRAAQEKADAAYEDMTADHFKLYRQERQLREAAEADLVLARQRIADLESGTSASASRLQSVTAAAAEACVQPDSKGEDLQLSVSAAEAVPSLPQPVYVKVSSNLLMMPDKLGADRPV
jgi:hypothetical protein